jgi:hypothetical protein
LEKTVNNKVRHTIEGTKSSNGKNVTTSIANNAIMKIFQLISMEKIAKYTFEKTLQI